MPLLAVTVMPRDMGALPVVARPLGALIGPVPPAISATRHAWRVRNSLIGGRRLLAFCRCG